MKVHGDKKDVRSKAPFSDRAAKKIYDRMLRIQVVWAGWMDRKINRLNRGKQLLLMGGFLLLTALVSTLSIVSAIHGPEGKAVQFKSNHGALPAVPFLQRPDVHPQGVDLEVEQKVQQFDQYMDSLERTESGRMEKKRFLDRYPGLMDSVLRIKELYNLR